MKFGVREICNVVFKAKTPVQIGNAWFQAGQPVLYIDTAKTATEEGAATTVYAQGGRGNTRLLAWEGEKTLTFTVEDALLSPIGFSVLSGAGLLQGTGEEEVHVHVTSMARVSNHEIDLSKELQDKETICNMAPIFVTETEKDGSLTGKIIDAIKVDTSTGQKLVYDESQSSGAKNSLNSVADNTLVMVDYYVAKKSAAVTELQIDAENFAGFYYVEADTLFRRQDTGKDMPAQLTFPKVKIQSNFTFQMASTGDPSTFTFTMDAMPDYTYFNPKKKVLCAMQIIDETIDADNKLESVFTHNYKGDPCKTFISADPAGQDVDSAKETTPLAMPGAASVETMSGKSK